MAPAATSEQQDPLVLPRLHRCAAPIFQLASTLSVRKATRDFDTYVHQAGSLRAYLGYNLPKKAVRHGVATVDLSLREDQLSLLFPDAKHLRTQRGRATWFDWLRPFMAICIAFALARAYHYVNYVPPYWDYSQYVLALFGVFRHAIVLVCSLLFVISVVVFHVWWTLLKITWPWLTGVESWTSTGLGDGSFVLNWLKASRENACSWHEHRWMYHRLCPPSTTTMIWRFSGGIFSSVAQAFWVVYPLLFTPLFWESVMLFLVLWRLLAWFLRRRTVWVVRLKVESQALSIARQQTVRAGQETTSEKVAATPILTHVENHVRMTHTNMPVEKRDRYLAICLLIASGWADNRIRVVQESPGEPDETEVQDNSRETLGDLGSAKRLLSTRTNTAKPNIWRRSVRVVRKTWSALFDEVQRGEDRDLPEADEVREKYSGVVTGPELFDISAGFHGGVEDEEAGVSRHLRKLRSRIDGEFLKTELDAEDEDRLDRATDIICGIVRKLAQVHFLSILSWALPQKWGSARDKFKETLVQFACTCIAPVLTGFVKLGELGLDPSKLPRLVGSMGMLCCAKDASVLCSVENLFKKFMPHLVIKGMTQEKVNARFDSFAKRAKRLGLKILSIDMSAMDSSWTMKDRARVRKVLQSVIDVVQELLDAELQLDYVSQCFAKKRALRWILRYLTVQLSAEDSILFSGERLTSIGNRILMLIIWSAELLRRYGSGDGEKRIEQMFYCPPTRFADMPDEPPVGIAEPVPINDDDFPDDPRYDNNIGDGDDCTLAIAQDMYASEEDFVRAYERYHKLVEPCSAWDEGTDLECLSTMAIAAGSGEHHKRYYVPKVQRNAQRLIAHKIRVPPAKHIAEGNPTYTPTKTEYSEICTDLWLRSFALRHSMVVRHLNRAMFEYCFSKCRDCKTKYDQDLHRLGKTDGDYRLADCLEQVRENARQDVCAFAMVKATNFKTMSTLSVSQVKALKAEWFESDDSWSNLELTDDLCARPDVLLTNFPVGTGVAAALGFRQELVAQLERQLVKPQGAGPDMRDGTRPGSTEVSRADGSGEADGDKIVRAASVMVYQDFAVLCGYEPRGKPREGMLTFPGGKLDKNESFEEAAIRELEEEAGVTTSKMSLEFVREFQCGHIQCKQYCVNANTTSPMTVLHADRLTDLKFRTAKEILMDHPLSKIAKCVREVIRLETLSDASTAYFYSQPGGSVSFRDHPPFRSGLQTPASAGSGPAGTAPGPQTLPGSSGDLVLRPSFEVKAGTAEVHAMGPPHPDEFKHTHFCQSCDTEYSHSHRHTPGVEHKQRKGDCPNPKCSYHKRVSNSGAGAHTSREPEEIRQPPASSPIIGCGTADSRKSEGKGRAGDTSASLSTSSVSQNAGKSHAGAAESKRNRSANRREGKGGKGNRAVPSTSRDQGTARAKEPKTVAQPTPDGPRATRRPKFADDGTAQTAASAMTLAPQPPSGPPVANPMACDSEAPRLFGFPGLSCARVPDARAASADFLASMAVIGSMMPHPPGIFSAADGTLLPPPPPPPPVIPEPSSGTLARAVSPTGIERAGISGHQQPDGDVTHPTTRRPGSQGV